MHSFDHKLYVLTSQISHHLSSGFVLLLTDHLKVCFMFQTEYCIFFEFN